MDGLTRYDIKSTQKINKLETPRLHMRSFSHILHRMKLRDNFF